MTAAKPSPKRKAVNHEPDPARCADPQVRAAVRIQLAREGISIVMPIHDGDGRRDRSRRGGVGCRADIGRIVIINSGWVRSGEVG